MSEKPVRHILGLSGGKDSTALAILLHKEIPQIEYFFCDTHEELPETYEYLERIKSRLGIKINYLNPERGFEEWLDLHGGWLPSPQRRWCTAKMKIVPLEKFIGDDEAISYIGIRADENREGYISTNPKIKPVYPFKERGLVKEDILRILEESGIGMPSYYRWRSRSGCYFCFFQRKYEWVMLKREHPDLFEKAVALEQNHKDGRKYTWSENESLLELIEREEEIILAHEKKSQKIQKKESLGGSSPRYLEHIMDEEKPCFMCHF